MPGFEVVAKDPAALAAAVDSDTAAVLLEPIQGETGIHPLSAELLAAARAACDRTGAALIFDEIQTGMGRTGTLWAYEQTGVVPDAHDQRQGARRGAADRRADHRTAVWPTSSSPATMARPSPAGPLVASAALVAMDICSDPELLARVVELGERLSAGLAELPVVAEVRGRGLMIGVDLMPGVSAPELAAAGADRAAARDQCHGAGDDPL